MAELKFLEMTVRQRDESGIKGLQDLCKLLPDNLTGVEIGSYAGESAEIFIRSGKFNKLYCVDFWSETYYKDRGLDRDNGESQFDELCLVYPEIIKVKMDSKNICKFFKDKDIDFIYIDCNHEYEFVKRDIENSLLILKGKGIISGHDYIETERNPFGGLIKAVNEFFVPDKIFIDTSWIKFL